MDIRILETIPELELICNNADGAVINNAYTSDLLSDVLANAVEESVLITIQSHKNTVAVASIAGCDAIIFCNNRPVENDVIAAAEEAEIALFTTKLTQFQSSVLIGKLLEENN